MDHIDPTSRHTSPVAPEPAPEAVDWDEEDSIFSWRLFAVLAVLLLLVTAVFVRYGAGARIDDAGSVADGGGADAGGDSVRITDAFAGERTDGLGTTETGATWEALGGTFGTRDGHAYLVTPNANARRAMVAVDLGATDGSVSATGAKLGPGWGLLFRYKGPYNYWMLLASPKLKGYSVVRVRDGKPVTIGFAGNASLEDGTTVGVAFQGPKISVLVNGVIVKTLTDDTATRGSKVGLLADLGAQDPQWSAFVATSSGAAPAQTGANDSRLAARERGWWP